jgi:D-alanine--D-alanine ligase
MSKLKVAVLMGGKSSEHEISLATGENIIKNLDAKKYQVIPIKITKDNQWTRQGKILEAEKALKETEVAFNALHGEYGEDGTIQGVLEFLGVLYTGSGVLASALSMDKVKSRALFRLFGLLTPANVVLSKETWTKKPEIIQDIIKKTKLPAVVKPTCLGSSVGVSIVREEKRFNQALKEAFHRTEKILLEDYIDGREVTCGILEDFNKEKAFALPVTEIIPPDGHFFDYQVKYNGQTQEITPAKIDLELTKKIQKIAQQAHQILGCQGYSRVDMILNNQDVYVLELNTLPGLTAVSLFPQAAKAVGLEFPQLLDHLINLALEKK